MAKEIGCQVKKVSGKSASGETETRQVKSTLAKWEEAGRNYFLATLVAPLRFPERKQKRGKK